MSGTMRQKRPGVWELRAYAGKDSRGRTVQRSRTFKGGQRAAQRALDDLVVEVRRSPVPTSASTVDELLEAYIEDRRPTLSPATIDVYVSAMRRLLSTAIADRPLSSATPLDVDQAYAALRAAGTTPHTMSQVHRFLCSAWNQAIRWQLATSNPVLLAQAPRVPRKRVEAPSVEDVRLLLKELDERDPDLADVLRIAASTGLRRGALCGLKWGDLEGDELVIRRSLITVGGSVLERPPKARADGEEERVYLTAAEVDRLTAIRDRQDAVRASGELDPVGPEGWVLSKDGAGVQSRRPDSVAHKITAACRTVGVSISPHDLRHFAATQMVGAGISIDTVARRLHHRDPALTLRTYAHPTAVDERAAGGAVERVLEFGGGPSRR